MNLDLLMPFSKDHAVQNVAFALEWQGELSDQTLLRIFSLKEKLRLYFQTVDLQKMMTVNLTPQEGVSSQRFEGLGGVVFQRINDVGGVSRQLAVNRQTCVYVVNDYTRWEPTIQTVMEHFALIVPIILADKAIAAVGLQYTDSFTWKDDPALLDMRAVFDVSSPFVVPHGYSVASGWHSHHGYLEPVEGIAPYERLNNVNVNVFDSASERTIQILTSHKASLRKPIRLSTENFLDVIKNIEGELHSHNKSLLSQVLSKDVAKKISLT